MPKELVISATPYETRVAILEEGQLCEIYIEREKEFALVGSIYKGRVTRVLPGMQSAFVDIGLDGDAFLYVSDFLENLEEYDHIVTTVEGKLQKMEQQGGQMFAPVRGQASAVQPPEVTPPSPSESGSAGESAPHDRNAAAPASPGHFSAPPAPGAPSYERRDFGSDQGRGRRGRWGRRGRGHRGHDRGRELPPSKFASPRPYAPRPYEPPSSEAEPVLLPGESLAKYKDRIPAVPLAPPAREAPAPAPSEVTSPPGESPREESSPALPESVYAPAPELAPESHPHTAEAPPSSEPEKTSDVAAVPVEPEEAPAERDEERLSFEAPPATAEAHSAAARQEPELSEDEMTALAEQLAEAKHEEAQAQAEEAEESELGESEEEEGAPLEALAETDEPHELHSEAEIIEVPGEVVSKLAPVDAAGLEAVEPPEPVEPQQTTARVEERPQAHFQRPLRRGGRHRGGRFGRHHDRFQARRPQLISEMLRPNQEIIVQIAKEPLGKKGARITSHVALPGRYLVYMPTVDHIGVSRKIASAEERARLRRLVAESKGTFPGGFIVRTAAEGATDEEIRSDVEFLGRTWGEIRARAEQRKAPALLHRDLNLVERILRDYLSYDYASIWVDSEEEFSKVVDFVSRFQPKLVSRVKLYTKETPIFEEFGIQQELDKALRPKVWLKSGGYIVINHTEALVAIDVNTGKYVGRGSTRLEDTIVKTNLEAVKEIVRQIRLRDLGGIIVVDFIDMEERRNREKVMAALDAALQSDRAPSKVLSFNEFGLVAITRKRTKQALERVLCQPCPYCTGSGMVKSIPTICYEIQAEARKMSAELDAQSLTLRVHPEIAKALKTRESALVEELEQATRKSVIIQSDPTLHWEQYDIY